MSFKIKSCAELQTYSSSPVNALIFSEDKYLISGGDDEVVRVWRMDTYECIQTLEHDNWGQVTALAFIVFPPSSGGTALCVGSGRGVVSIIPMVTGGSKPFNSDRIVDTTPFRFNDSVELQAYDKQNSRLALASHSGMLAMYKVDDLGLNSLWTGTLNLCIPGGIFFMGQANESITTITLDTSEMCCRESLSGSIIWKKDLKGGIGSVAVSKDRNLLLLNNLSTGKFDLYKYPEAVPLKSLPLISTRRFIKQSSFLDEGQLVVCGSDKNFISIVDVSSNRLVETIRTGKEINMTQTVAASHDRQYGSFIAAECGGTIFVWKKLPIYSSSPLDNDERSNGRNENRTRVSMHWIYVAIIALLTYPNWVPVMVEVYHTLADMLRPASQRM